jgi:Dolichyl-phosphate-mannose-protein mannosyltransferase
MRKPSWVTVAFAALFLFGSIYYFRVTVEKYGHPTVRVSNDGRYQYALAVSMYEDGDLDLTDEYAADQLGNPHKYGPTQLGYPANPLSIGPALLWAPSYFVARLFDPSPLGDLHQQITFYPSFLCAFGALLLVYSMARRRYGPGASFAGALIAVLCGPVLQYAIHQPSYSHAASAFFVALLFWEWDRQRDARPICGWVRCGAILGAAMLMRAQNVVFVLPLLAEGIAGVVRARRARALVGPAAGALTCALLFAAQLAAWDAIYGFGLSLPQGGGFMRWGSSMLVDTLFSSMNGLFLYAPFWIVGVFGLAALATRDRATAGWLALTFLVVAYVNGAVNDWWALGGIVNRRYDGVLVHVGLGIAAVATALAARPKLATGILVGGAALFGALLNFGMWDLYTRYHRDKELDQSHSIQVYTKAIDHLSRRYLKRLGNPLAWPAAVPFALLTGARVSQYEEVVGHHLLEGRIERGDHKHNKRFEERQFRFSFDDTQVYLLGGFGGMDASYRREVGHRARFLAPINTNYPVRCHLVGLAVVDVDLEVQWNGERISGGRFAAGAPIDLWFTVPPARVTRGINVVTLLHVNVEKGTVGAAYDRIELRAGD